MSNYNQINQTQEEINDFYVPDEDKIKNLRDILQDEAGCKIPIKDAEEVGLQLIGLFECLARDRKIIRGRSDGENA